MKKWMFYLAGVILFAGILAACNKDDDDPDNCAEGWEIAVNTKLQAAIDAGQVWAMSGVKEDCEKYKDALYDYLDAVRDLEDCYVLAGQKQAWEQAIQESEDDINSITCE